MRARERLTGTIFTIFTHPLTGGVREAPDRRDNKGGKGETQNRGYRPPVG